MAFPTNYIFSYELPYELAISTWYSIYTIKQNHPPTLHTLGLNYITIKDFKSGTSETQYYSSSHKDL